MQLNILYAPLKEIPRSQILIFAGDDCYPCKKLLDYLFRAGVLFSNHIKVIWIRNEDAAIEWALQNGINEIPLVMINNQIVEGSEHEVAKRVVKYMLENNIITQEELYKNLRKVVWLNAKYLGEKIGLEIIVNEKMIPALINRVKKFYMPYCPCRLELKEENICPCDHSLEELKENGYCKCRLFLVKK